MAILHDVITSSSFPYIQDSPDLYANGSFRQAKESLFETQLQAFRDPESTCRREVAACADADSRLKSGDKRCFRTNYLQSQCAIPDITSTLRSSVDESSETDANCHDGDLQPCVYDDVQKSIGSAQSELVCQFGSPPRLLLTKRPCDYTSSRRRVSEESDYEEVESSLIKRQRSEDTNILDVSGSPDIASSESQLPHNDGPSNEDDDSLDQSVDDLQMLCDHLCFETPEKQCSSCTEAGIQENTSSGSAKEARRQQIEATVQLLKEAIPGGDSMETNIVLDEAIHYVKLLQLQVQTLVAKRIAERATR